MENNAPNWKDLTEDGNHQYLMGLPDDVSLYLDDDTWDADTACRLITLGCVPDMQKMRLRAKQPIQAPEFDAIMARSACEVYDLAVSRAQKSINGGHIKEHATPREWLEWAVDKGYSVSHLRDDAQPVKKEITKTGLPKKLILTVDWPLTKELKLDNALSDVSDWLKPARMTPGSRGKSALWNPALLAFCLCDKGYSRKSAMDSHIRLYFPDWVGEWEDHKEKLP